jgi:hypothetical protein
VNLHGEQIPDHETKANHLIALLDDFEFRDNSLRIIAAD